MVCFGEKNFLQFDWSYFLIYLNPLYKSYLPISTLFIISFFSHLIQKQPSAATATAVAPVVSDNGKSLYVLFIASLHSYNYGGT